MPVRAPLPWAEWNGPAQALPEWLARHAARLRGGAVVGPPDLASHGIAAFAAALRSSRLVPAVRIAADRLDTGTLDALGAAAPLLIALAPPVADGMEVWRSVRRRLAQLRSPHLRFAEIGNAICHVGDFRPDVRLAAPSGSDGSGDLRCAPCAVRATCPGPQPGHAVALVPRAVSNQFDLVELPENSTSAGEPGGSDRANAAHLHLRAGETLRDFATPPGDLAALGLADAVARGQLYVDISEKARLDDFAADLRLLSAAGEPAPHSPQPGCMGVWQALEMQPFEAEERLLRERLTALRGLVVDVGAGPIRYLAELRSALREGTVRYLAVEPDRAALDRARADLPDGAFVRGTGERLPVRDGRADVVLMLRSFNHLRDTGAGLAEAARVLRRDGLLVIADNVAFGLLRTPAQLARARAVPLEATPFEHFRNADAAAARHALAELGGCFEPVEVHEVAPGQSNQWLVVARRTRSTTPAAPAP